MYIYIYIYFSEGMFTYFFPPYQSCGTGASNWNELCRANLSSQETQGWIDSTELACFMHEKLDTISGRQAPWTLTWGSQMAPRLARYVFQFLEYVAWDGTSPWNLFYLQAIDTLRPNFDTWGWGTNIAENELSGFELPAGDKLARNEGHYHVWVSWFSC